MDADGTSPDSAGYPHDVARNHLRELIAAAKHWPRVPDRGYRVDPERVFPGWLLPVLQACDAMCWGRWPWHTLAWAQMRLPDEPLPRIEFEGKPHPLALKMLEASLNAIPGCGEWQSWDSWRYLEYFLDWLLFGFGHTAERPPEPEKGACDRLYQVFCLEALIAWPHDYFGNIMAENRFGRGLGFYPTPHNLSALLAGMLFTGTAEDLTQEVVDPCVGTGRMLLHASNHSVCLYGQDINPVCVKATLVNGYLYAPWLALPFAWLQRKVIACPESETEKVMAVEQKAARQGEFGF